MVHNHWLITISSVWWCKVQRQPCLSDYEILREWSREKNSITTLGFSRAEFSLFMDLLRRVSQHNALEGSGVQENWLFKNHFLQPQEQFIPMKMLSGENNRMTAWMNKEILTKLKHKSKQKVEASMGNWEEYRDTVQACRDGVRKAKTTWSWIWQVMLRATRKAFTSA